MGPRPTLVEHGPRGERGGTDLRVSDEELRSRFQQWAVDVERQYSQNFSMGMTCLLPS